MTKKRFFRKNSRDVASHVRKALVVCFLFILLGGGGLYAQNDTIQLTWRKSSNVYGYNFIHIDATAGKLFTINWGDGSTETRMGTDTGGVGVWLPSINHTYVNNIDYEVTITGTTPDCRITVLNLTSVQLILK